MSRIFAQLRAPRIVAVTPAGSPLPAAVAQLGVDITHRWPDPDQVLQPRPLVVIVDAQEYPAELLAFVTELRCRDELVPIVGIFREFGLLSLTPAQGVTDFVIADAGARELGLRLERAVARPALPLVRNRTEVGAIELSTHGFGVRILGRDIRLSGLEHELMRLLLVNRDRVLEHTEVARALTEVGCRLEPGAVRIVVSRTRAKLGPDAAMIATVRGIGYRLVAPRSPDPVRAAS